MSNLPIVLISILILQYAKKQGKRHYMSVFITMHIFMLLVFFASDIHVAKIKAHFVFTVFGASTVGGGNSLNVP